MDLSRYARGKYLKASDLEGPTVVTILGGRADEMPESGETKPVLLLQDFPPLVLNKTNLEMVRTITGTLSESDEWRGYQCLLQVERVPFSGKMVDGIRLYPADSRAARPQTRPAPSEREAPQTRPASYRGPVGDPSGREGGDSVPRRPSRVNPDNPNATGTDRGIPF